MIGILTALGTFWLACAAALLALVAVDRLVAWWRWRKRTVLIITAWRVLPPDDPPSDWRDLPCQWQAQEDDR